MLVAGSTCRDASLAHRVPSMGQWSRSVLALVRSEEGAAYTKAQCSALYGVRYYTLQARAVAKAACFATLKRVQLVAKRRAPKQQSCRRLMVSAATRIWSAGTWSRAILVTVAAPMHLHSARMRSIVALRCTLSPRVGGYGDKVACLVKWHACGHARRYAALVWRAVLQAELCGAHLSATVCPRPCPRSAVAAAWDRAACTPTAPVHLLLQQAEASAVDCLRLCHRCCTCDRLVCQPLHLGSTTDIFSPPHQQQSICQLSEQQKKMQQADRGIVRNRVPAVALLHA